MNERVTYVEAAEILRCHVSNVAKLVRKGALKSAGRGRDGALLRVDVEALAGRRQQRDAARSQQPIRRRVDHRPDVDHDWLSARQTAALVGLTRQAITKRVRRGTLPGVAHGGRVWVRADHLELVERARLAQRTKTPR